MNASLAAARTVQRRWQSVPVRHRVAIAARLRARIAENSAHLAQLTAAPNDRTVAEKLVSEVIPLLDACRFLERRAGRVLRTKRYGARGRPVWLRGSTFVVERRPFGVVLIIGPRNYPLFLPAVQMLQALVAGNAVLLKPAAGCSAPMSWLAEQLFARDLIERDLLQLLPEPPESAQQAVRAGVDKVIFTGSSENGRNLLALLAERNTPGVFELSGADPVIVRQDADLERVVKAIAFGRRINAGDTCMAPQSVLAHQAVAGRLRQSLHALGLEVRAFDDDRAAIELARQSEFGLGASIFSADEKAAQEIARELPTGFVTINDLIVPTADPRFPFGGVRGSGFGTTRGAEGLLEMTYPHAIATRRGRFLPHLEEPPAESERIFTAYIRSAYGSGLGRRFKALRQLIRAVKERRE